MIKRLSHTENTAILHMCATNYKAAISLKIELAVCIPCSPSVNSTSCRLKVFQAEKSRKFQKAKLEFNAHWQLFI